jgi:hypothetical protein
VAPSHAGDGLLPSIRNWRLELMLGMNCISDHGVSVSVSYGE